MHAEPIAIIAFAPANLAGVVALLRRCLPLENVTEELFTCKVLLDANFRREGALTARSPAGEIVGFVLAIAERGEPAPTLARRERGWITLFAVAPEWRRRGIGGLLFEKAETFLSSQGCASAWISPYGPGYWTPGVDEAAYPEAIAWLPHQGYHPASRPLSMAVDLTADWSPPEDSSTAQSRLSAAGLSILPFTPAHALPILVFLRREFSADWLNTAQETMRAILAGYRPTDSIWTAMRGGDCIGFAHWSGERFGPIGVADAERGRGIGGALMVAVLQAMRRAGRHRAYFLWTLDDTAARLYHPAGFREVRRFQLFQKPLLPPALRDG